MPTRHAHVVATGHNLSAATAADAIDDALAAKDSWSRLPFEQRAAVFLKAADLLVSPKYRSAMAAATMLGQGKNVWQAEIDCVAEMADFWRFNVKYAEEIYSRQPQVVSSPSVWNRMEYRPLEGFVVAIAPFNFTAIGANLPCAPALMGNTVVFKPSPFSLLSNYLVYEILVEAGLPPGVINFLPGDGKVLGEVAFRHEQFAGLHFTGSTKTFNAIWKEIASNLDTYKSYPRIVGETGGKNFHFIHESACVDTVINHTIRGAFEYQGQKCSATSRMYVPDNLWPTIRDKMLSKMGDVRMGCVTDFGTLVNAVISKDAFKRISGYIARARESSSCEIIFGGKCDDSDGYFIEPTVIITTDPHYETMREEIFGPVLTVYVYDHTKMQDALDLCNTTATFGLTGSIFARDRNAIQTCLEALRNAAGNIYVNDKSTGAVVGQQPFGGSRRSGTNDKSGSALNLTCWVSPLTIKETFTPLLDYAYPHMRSEK
ncbi:hypothetical protein PBRA_000367 [Plasmodiophora brassicae]|nr:hypothetical protein PBRA_000367 [Plasmodiophora brassicae]